MYSISLSFVLICGLSLLSTIGGQKVDNCSLLKPDDRYEGIELYIEFIYVNNGYYRLVNRMYRRGYEWQFEMTYDHKIEFLPQTEIIPTYNAKKFGVNFFFENKTNGNWTQDAYNCVNETDFNTFKCFNAINDKKVYTVTKNDSIGGQIDKQSIIFRPYVNESIPYSYHTLILNKKSKQKIWIESNPNSGNLKFVSVCDENCPEIGWIDELDDSMLDQLDGVIGLILKYENKTLEKEDNVFMLWFNINGKPMYCITQESERLSYNCQSNHTLIQAFPECFVSSNDYIWLSILAVEVVLAFILIYAIYRVIEERNRRLIGSHSKSAPTTYDPSLSESNNSLA